jgi:membrane-bound inhibitor of C-type lysozyme
VACKHALLALLALGSAAPPASALPPEIAQALSHRYTAPGTTARYLDAEFDLNDDGRPEVIVHVVGPMECGTGGCPTLVFTPRGGGYRLVSAISVSRPPIRVSSAGANGWHNLVVHSGGGGASARDVELLFDGKRYPANPSVNGPRVRPFVGADAGVLIAQLPLPAQVQEQRRAIEAGIRSGRWPAAMPTDYVCEGREDAVLSVALYNQTEPPSAVIKFGERETVVLEAPSGSGARYVNGNVEFWEHQGDAQLV